MTASALPGANPHSRPRGSPGETKDGLVAPTIVAQARVIAANRAFYSQIAKKYEQYESCTFEPYLQRILENDLNTIHSFSTSLGRTPHCLDCGGGTGNLALKMLARGWNVTVVDLSDEMLELLKKKAQAAGHAPRLVHSSIEQFLKKTPDIYDLVAFSSVLHHLHSYTAIVQQVASIVRPRGFFYSNFDPVPPKSRFWTPALDSLDIAIAKMMFDPADVLPGIGRRLAKSCRRIDPMFHRALVSAGDLAEYHAHTGVDDAEIIRLLRRNGFRIVEHLRYPAGRTRAVRFLNRRFRLLDNFRVIARRDPGLVETAIPLPFGEPGLLPRQPRVWNALDSGIDKTFCARASNPPPAARDSGARPKQLQEASVSRPERLWKDLQSKREYLTGQEAWRRAPMLTLSRLLLWRVRCLLRRPAIVSLRRWNLQMFLPSNWRGVEKLIFAFREDYEPELQYIAQVLSPGMTFIDAGACYGIYALRASKIVGSGGRVIAFEPASRAFPVLRKNIELNRLTNVLAYPLALTEKKSKAWLYHHPNVGCDSLGRDHSFTETAEQIATESLDNILRELAVDQVHVIKMDVQGAEELILRGASKILNSAHPLVIFEVFPEGTMPLGLSPYGAWELLHDMGYEFFVADGSGTLSKVKSPSANRNFVAIYRQ